MVFSKSLVASLLLSVAASGTAFAQSSANLVTNGSFEQSPFGANSQFGSAGYGNLNGWSVNSLNGSTPFDLWFQAGTSTTVGATSQYGSQYQDLVPSFSDTAADGNDFVSLDGDPHATGVLSQAVSGLKLGDTYTLSFSWAATQMQTGTATAYNIALAYNLGGSALTSSTGGQTTGTINLAHGASTNWMTVTTTFIATSTQEVLSFLSYGGPVGGPPIALLDNVSLYDTSGTPATVPEPASLTLLGGAALIGFIARRRSRRAS
jgi:hypothetical protein